MKPIQTTQLEDQFATIPIITPCRRGRFIVPTADLSAPSRHSPISVENPVTRQTDNLFSDEEELYTSFEQAISDRIMTLNRRPNHSSNLLPYAPQDYLLQSQQSQLFMNRQYIVTNPSFLNTWQQTILIICLALILLMLGFDLMGLLILLMR